MNTSFIILFLNLGSGEIVIIVLLFLLFFGADKIPEMARSIGRGMREMKNATAEIQREIEKGASEIKRDVNLDEQAAGIKEAADTFRAQVDEGLKAGDETKPADKDEDKDNPLIPPDAISRS